jgi:Zn ribbon nucleic-acid-binding protein
MSVYYIKKVFLIVHCSFLIKRIIKFRLTAIIVCILCARASTLYIFFRDSVKCLECVRKSVAYNRNFLAADFDKFSEEEIYLKAAYI